MKPFNELKSYRKFVNARDQALEAILRNTRLRVADKLNGCFTQILQTTQSEYPLLNAMFHPVPIKQRLHLFEKRLNQIFEAWAIQIAMILINQRKMAYTLAYAGETEAISQVLNKSLNIKLHQQDLNWAYHDKLEDGQTIQQKVDLAFSRLRRVILNEVELSIAMDDDVEVCLGRIMKKLPKKLKIEQARKLKKLPKEIREADGPVSIRFTDLSQVDRETMNQINKDYQQDFTGSNRSPEEAIYALDPYTGEKIEPDPDMKSDEIYYGWEIERDATHDFVQQVRDGQVDAANEAGVDEFIVIAILDNRTCESCCGDDIGCYTFNGMLTSEVAKLTKGEYDVPPYHFNCRCSLAPASKSLELYDTSPTEKDFDEWLKPNG
jgi:hypothetical protein